MAETPPAFRIAHAIAVRTRLVALGGDIAPEALRDAGARLAAMDGVIEVAVRASSRSLVVRHAEHWAGPGASGLTIIADTPAADAPLRETLSARSDLADLGLKLSSDGRLDLATIGGVLLGAAALIQLGRGQIAGPALTLALQAVQMLSLRRS